MSKKGSLSLSVNAIVVLILAIVMLGLGMAFIRGMFGQVEDQFKQKISEENEPVSPTRGDPLTISREYIITHSDDNQALKIAVLNPTNETYADAKPVFSCSNGPSISQDANAKNIAPNSVVEYTMKLTASGAVNSYLCLLEVSGNVSGVTKKIPYSKDITIDIEN